MFKRRSKNENNKHIFQFHGLKSDNKSTRVYFQRIFTQFSIYFFLYTCTWRGLNCHALPRFHLKNTFKFNLQGNCKVIFYIYKASICENWDNYKVKYFLSRTCKVNVWLIVYVVTFFFFISLIVKFWFINKVSINVI